MNIKKVFVFLLICTVQATFAANLMIFNKTGSDIEVTVRWGTAKGQTILITKDGRATFNSSILHKFDSLVWREAGTGIHNLIDMPSPRIMSDGFIELYSQGNFRINFNGQGKYKYNQVEVGNSKQYRTFSPTGIYR